MSEKSSSARPARLSGKVALVTGASRGIGLAIAKALAAEGCAVVAAARKVSRLRAAFRGQSSVAVQACDVRDQRSVARLFAGVKRRFKRLDILINNAGIAHPMRNVADLDLETWRDVLDTNLTGTFLCTRAALPLMGRGGVIVNNLSVAARSVFVGESAYCASKHGALGFTDTLREELRERGIRVVALLPGPTTTDIWNQFWPEAPRDKMMSPQTVSAAVINILCLPESAAVDEIRLTPVAGTL